MSKNKKIKNILFFSIVITMDAVLAIGTIATAYCNMNYKWIQKIKEIISNYISIKHISVNDVYFSQLSLTFITISLITVLSEKTITLYWKNLVEEILVRPKFKCLYAFVTYSFSTVFLSTIAVLVDNKIAICIFFAMDILFLTRLTYTMLNVYFSREKQKKNAVKEYKKIEFDMGSDNCNVKENAIRKKNEIMDKLKEKTLQAFSNNNINIVMENIDFYVRYCSYDDVEYLMYLIEAKDVDYAKKIIYGFSERIKNELKSENNLDIVLEKYSPLNQLPNHITNQIMKKNSESVWNDLFEVIMCSARNILVECFNKIYEKKVEIINLSYNEFRYGVRERIDKFKINNQEYSAEDIYKELKENKGYKINLRIGEFEKVLEIILPTSDEERSIENKKAKQFHDIIRKSPIEFTLSMMEKVFDLKNYYYMTVFIAIFIQFPVFKYLYCLNEKHNNNGVYTRIKEKLKNISEFSDEFKLNEDWVSMYEQIVKEKNGKKKLWI